MRYFFISLLFFLSSAAWLSAQNIPAKPEPARYMVDNAFMLGSQDAAIIEDKLYAYFLAEGTQIVVVTVESLGGATVEEYAEKLFKTWGIGDKDRNDGILLLISKSDRKMRIEVGYGLESRVTDAIAANIINGSLAPNFKNQAFYEGIAEATNQLIAYSSPDYKIPISRRDSLRAAIQAEKRATETKDKQARAAASAANWRLAFYIGLGLLAFALLIKLVTNYLHYLQKQAGYFADCIKSCETISQQLDNIRKLKAYAEIAAVRDFVENYSELVKTSLAHLEQKRGLEENQILIADHSASLSGYLILSVAYQKVALRRDSPRYESYPEEQRRVEEKNIRELQTLANSNEIKKSSNHSLINAISERLPAKKLSVEIETRLVPFAQLGSRYDIVKIAAIDVFKNIEESADFQAKIKAEAQEKVVLDDKITLAFNYVDKQITVLQLLQTASQQIEKIELYSQITALYKSIALDAAKAEASRILKKIILPFFEQDLSQQLKEKLADSSIDADITAFYSLIYAPIFKELQALLTAFNAPQTLINKYKASYTEASINALHNGITAALAKLSSDFEAGKHERAFAELVDIFNGTFKTSLFLDKFLTKIPTPTRSYTSSSSASTSSYTPAYADYKPPYSDYKPPYSDYSDYKDYSDYSDYSDSSYGGGSSGGGGASGGW